MELGETGDTANIGPTSHVNLAIHPQGHCDRDCPGSHDQTHGFQMPGSLGSARACNR